jgi:hypothetical protein
MNYGPLSLYCFACHFEYQIHKPAAVLLLVTYESKAIKKICKCFTQKNSLHCFWPNSREPLLDFYIFPRNDIYIGLKAYPKKSSLST